jgi:hypothetical protein
METRPALTLFPLKVVPLIEVLLYKIISGNRFKFLKNCLGRATKKMDIPNARKKKLHSKLHIHSIQFTNPFVHRRYLKRQKPNAEAREG